MTLGEVYVYFLAAGERESFCGWFVVGGLPQIMEGPSPTHCP